MKSLKTIFGQQIYLKWNHCLQTKKVKYLLCVIDAFTRYTWIKPLKDKKVKQFLLLLLK